MKIVLATGIYPPAIGGPATYTRALAEELHAQGHEVCIITYARESDADAKSPWPVVRVSASGGPLLRWMRYARSLKEHAVDADVVYCFSSVSTGIPLLLARLARPKKILRLGGDFLWERYTSKGGTKSLRDFYDARYALFVRIVMGKLLRSFHHIVFSTAFQEEIYASHYAHLPRHSVIENALTFSQHETDGATRPHRPFALLFMGRFVGFKNLPVLVEAMQHLPEHTLTIVGQGPWESRVRSLVHKLHLEDRITFHKPVHGKQKQETFDTSDLLVIPSITEISPNVALEAHSYGLPVLLTRETGLSNRLRSGMVIADLSTPERLARAASVVVDSYEETLRQAASGMEKRPWSVVANEHVQLFSQLLA